MVVSHKDKIIFIHIPKCAGTTIEDMICKNKTYFMKLCGYCCENKYNKIISKVFNLFSSSTHFRNFVIVIFSIIYYTNKDKYLFTIPEYTMNHTPIKDLIIKNYLNINSFIKYKKFTIVRNPFDRAVSCYKHFKFNSKYKFEDFCIYLLNENIKFNNGDININVMVLPQYYFIYYNNTLLIDDILYFENLQNDWIKIIDKYNLNFNKKLYTKNKSNNNNNYLNYYNEFTIKIIQNIYYKDFFYFDYNINL